MQIMKNRISYIDIAKGIGIFLVIWGHIILSGPAYNIIYAFHMPLFFFLSGFVFSKNKYHNIKEFFISKIKKNYLRIVVTVFLGILGCIITTTENNIFNFKELFWSIEIALVAIPFYIFGIEVTNKISNNFAFFKNFDCRKFGNI